MRKCSYGVPLSKNGMRFGINGRIYEITNFKEEMNDDYDFANKDFVISGLLNGKPFEFTHHTIQIGEQEDEGGWNLYDEVEDSKGKFDVVEEDVTAVWDWLSDLCYDVVNQQETEYEVEGI